MGYLKPDRITDISLGVRVSLVTLALCCFTSMFNGFACLLVINRPQ